MRRVVPVAIAVLGLVLGPVTAALAAPSAPPVVVPSPVPGQPVCTVEDDRLVELSGLVATDTGYVVVNDSNDNNAAMRIFFLNQQCKFQRSVGYPNGARDPEDLAVAPDGTLWVADTGDNPTSANHRTTIALWKLAPGTNTEPVRYRLTYPDGAHDAEALVLGGNGTPVIVTKEASGTSGVYVPAAPLSPTASNGVQLTRAGQFKATRTGTSGFLGIVGQGLVTGGANSPDGKRVALRTYSDAYEWDVPDGDVVKAITTGTPRITPLPDEPQGESIAYSRDGKSFLTLSDQQQGAVKMLRYTPASATAKPAPARNVPAVTHGDARGWFQKLSLQQVTYLVALVGVLGLVLVLVGVYGIRRSRETRRTSVAREAGTTTGAVRGAARVSARAGAAAGDDRPAAVVSTVRDARGTRRAYAGDDDTGGTTYGAPYGGTPRYGSGGRSSPSGTGSVYGSAPEEPDPGYDYPRRH